MQMNRKQITISKLTNLCKDLQNKQKDETSGQSLPVEVEAEDKDEKEVERVYRAPFAIRTPTVQYPGLVFHNNVWKTSNQVVAETNKVRPLTDKFPVSAGLVHKATMETGGGGGGGSGEGGGVDVGPSTTSVFGEHKVSVS